MITVEMSGVAAPDQPHAARPPRQQWIITVGMQKNQNVITKKRAEGKKHNQAVVH